MQLSWEVKVQPDNNPTWEFLWDSRIDESREKGLLQIAFTTESNEMQSCGGDSSCDREIQVAEAALKVPVPCLIKTHATNMTEDGFRDAKRGL